MLAAIGSIVAAIIAAIVGLVLKRRHDYAAGRAEERVRNLEASIKERKHADKTIRKARAAGKRAANVDSADLLKDDGHKRKRPKT